MHSFLFLFNLSGTGFSFYQTLLLLHVTLFGSTFDNYHFTASNVPYLIFEN